LASSRKGGTGRATQRPRRSRSPNTFLPVVDGLIGADFFIGRIVQIDFAREKIRLLENYSPPVKAEVLPILEEFAKPKPSNWR
jgi:hypothetical protein